MKSIEHFWSYSPAELFHLLDASENGISNESAYQRLQEQRQIKYSLKNWQKDALLLFRQYKNPLVLLLVFAATLSLILGEYSDSSIIIMVLLLTGLFGFFQERKASRAVEELSALGRNKAEVVRNGKQIEIYIDEVVPGDIVVLNAGDIIPADMFILEAKDLHVNESLLTGESYPAEKFPGECGIETPHIRITNSLFRGTNVVNGTARALAVNAAQQTELGKIALGLQKHEIQTAFEKGIHQFGYLLMRITVVIALLILVLNILFHKPVIDSLLFALALAIGMTPELLPAIVTITLSAGARRMAGKKVIVKKLSAIQNLGEMDILCADKTGTLTEGVVRVEATVDYKGNDSPKLREYVYLNAHFETGFSNPIDVSIRCMENVGPVTCKKKDEVPYDFIRKRLSVVIDNGQRDIMITKGAVSKILECCTKIESADGTIVGLQEARKGIEELFLQFSQAGYRTIAVCYKDVTGDPVINKDDETDMIFLGYVTFSDPVKKGIMETMQRFQRMGITLKLITGDNFLVARHVAAAIGLSTDLILTGEDMHQLTSEAIQQKVTEINVFAEIEPIQKEQIIYALQKNGHAVGFLGDGINDANALKAADVGISVEGAVDVAKEAADLVLLEKDFDVILEGVIEGRKTFMNTLKYIFVTTSANFGNMFSLALASLFLPFLPLLPVQVLLNNFLSDLPALAIASDKVDEDAILKPRRWDMNYIKRFMITFGLESSVFDLLTFALLLYVFHASKEIFRTAWFIESLLTEILILLIIRTVHPFLKSKPSTYLVTASIFAFCVTIILPYLPVARTFSLYPIPVPLLFTILAIAALYVVATELTKKFLMKKL